MRAKQREDDERAADARSVQDQSLMRKTETCKTSRRARRRVICTRVIRRDENRVRKKKKKRPNEISSKTRQNYPSEMRKTDVQERGPRKRKQRCENDANSSAQNTAQDVRVQCKRPEQCKAKMRNDRKKRRRGECATRKIVNRKPKIDANAKMF